MTQTILSIFRGALFLILIMITTNSAMAQTKRSSRPGKKSLSVYLTIDDPSGGVIASPIRTAIRTLDDIKFVDESEQADYILDIQVMCSPEAKKCDNTIEYISVVRVEQNISTALFRIVGLAYKLPIEKTVLDPDAAARLTTVFKQYRRTAAQWLLRWSTLKYESGIKQIVAKIDAGCFEKQRWLTRLSDAAIASSETKDTTTLNKILRMGADTSWACQ